MATFRIIRIPRQWILIAATIVTCALYTTTRSVADDTPHFTFTQGAVDVDYPSGAQTTAANGTPVSPSGYVTTGADSQAEIQIDAYAAIRLGPNSQVRVPDANGERRLQIATGTVELTIFRNGEQSIEMDTPSITVSARESGAYRISVNDSGQTNVTVRRGHAEVITPDHTYELNAGNAFVAYGSASNPKTAFAAAPTYDAFDDFNGQRDDQYRDDQNNDEGQPTETQPHVEPNNVIVAAPDCGFGPSVGYYGYGWGLSLGFYYSCSGYASSWFSPWFGGYGYGYGYPWYPVAYGVPYPYPYPYPYPNPTPRPRHWHARTPVPPRRRERDGGHDVFGTPVRLASHSAPTANHDEQARHTVTAAIYPMHLPTVTVEQHRVATVQQHRAAAAQQHRAAVAQQHRVAQARPIWDRPITTAHNRPVWDRSVTTPRDRPALERPASDPWDRFDRARGNAGVNAPSGNYAAPRPDVPRLDAPRVDAPRVDGPRVETLRVDMPRTDSPRMDAPRMDAPRMDAPRIQAPPPHVGGMRPPI